MTWFGADPGGRRNRQSCFGVAWLRNGGTFETANVECAHEAFEWVKKKTERPKGIGIDCPLWWSSWKSGERQVDVFLRKRYRDRIGQTIQSINSLRGAVLVQGVMLALRAREHYANVPITETHPKALLKAMRIDPSNWSDIASKFGFRGQEPDTGDELDALISAAVARNGITGAWNYNLTGIDRNDGEMNPERTCCGAINYYWFESITAQT